MGEAWAGGPVDLCGELDDGFGGAGEEVVGGVVVVDGAGPG